MKNDYPRFPIPDKDVDYREVARVMRINIDILKKELSEHVDKEIRRFNEEINDCEEKE